MRVRGITYRSLEGQKDVFERILRGCASEGGKVLSVHSVRAATQVLDMIEEHLRPARGKVVLHWFTGSPAEASRAVGLGCYFSINAEMLQGERGTKIVRSLPGDCILSETDGPFTSASGSPRQPVDVEDALRGLAALRQVEVEECRNALFANLKTLVSDAPIIAAIQTNGVGVPEGGLHR